MQRAESAFWTSQNSSYVRPVDVAVRKISSFEAVGFVRGVRSVFNVIEAADPDIIFLPERGAGPIDWALQRFGEIYRGKERFKVFLPIGTCVDPFTCAEWGPGKRDKSEIVGKIVGNLRETRDWLSKPLLIDEVQSVTQYRSKSALQTVGYKEVFEYLDGTISKDEAIQQIKHHTRQYAKRQMTWFKKDAEFKWINMATHSVEAALQEVLSLK